MSADPAEKQAKPHWIVRGLAAIGVIALVLVLIIGSNLWNMRGDYQPAEVAGAAPEVTFTLGSAQELQGTNLIEIDVAVSGEANEPSPYSGGGPDIRNILLVDKASGASRKLLPDNSRRIANTRYFSAEEELVDPEGDLVPARRDGDTDTAPYEYYTLSVKAPERGGPIDLLVGVLRTGQQAYVMRGLDGIDAMWTHSPAQLGFIVREKRTLYHRIVDVPTLKVIQSKRIVVD